MQEKMFDVSKYDLDINSFTLSQLNGEDEIAAEARSNGNAFAFSEQLIAQSLVAVDGERVQRPYISWKQWSTRTREFVRAAYQRMNSTRRDEVDDFLSEAFDGADEPAEVISVSN